MAPLAQQNKYEFEQLLALYVAEKPMHVLEIGTSEGGTLYQWLRHARPGSHVMAIDVHNGFDYGEMLGIKPNTTRFDFIVGDSHDRAIVERVGRELAPIDWLFIDGDHTYSGVKSDYELYAPMVRTGGKIALHDIRATTPDCHVEPFWEELVRSSALTIEIVDKDCRDPRIPQWRLGIGIVYK